jgi:hypothetical protein
LRLMSLLCGIAMHGKCHNPILMEIVSNKI